MQTKAHYGIDAPTVVRNLFLFAFLALVTGALLQILQTPFFWVLSLYTVVAACTLFTTGCWMLYSSKIAKPRIISQLTQNLSLKGDENILDAGCGRGIFSIEAAKKLSIGKVFAIDIWSSKDQSGNRIQSAHSNAKAENVKERIEIQTGDMRSLPYADDFFDLVISSLAIHNIPGKEGRDRALSEILRVLKPGGQFCLLDIFQGKSYAEYFQEKAELTSFRTLYAHCPFVYILQGRKNPIRQRLQNVDNISQRA